MFILQSDSFNGYCAFDRKLNDEIRPNVRISQMMLLLLRGLYKSMFEMRY
jgi:hypothetical protein